MLLSGYYLYQGKDVEKYDKPPFVDHYIVKTTDRAIGCGYYEFESERIEEFKAFLSKTHHIMCRKKLFLYQDGTFTFVTKAPKTAREMFLYYKKAYMQIDKRNQKYAHLKQTILPIGKIGAHGFRRFRYCDQLDFTLPFCLHLPPQKLFGQKFPLYIYLHGYACGGEQALRPIFMSKNFYQKIDFSNSMVLLPSLPEAIGFVTDFTGQAPFAGSRSFDGLLSSLLDVLIDTYPIDEKRIYLLGSSNGAMGVYSQIQLHPDRYAAAVALMGSMNLDALDTIQFQNMPLWIAHGADDTNIPITKDINGYDGSDVIYQKLGGSDNQRIRYTRYEKGGHKIDQIFFKEQPWYEWLAKQTTSRCDLGDKS